MSRGSVQGEASLDSMIQLLLPSSDIANHGLGHHALWAAHPTHTNESNEPLPILTTRVVEWSSYHMTWNQKIIAINAYNKYPSVSSVFCLYLLRTVCSISYIGPIFVTYSTFRYVKSDRNLALKRPEFALSDRFLLPTKQWKDISNKRLRALIPPGK